MLAAEGLLELLPNRGAIITRQSADELDEVFGGMVALEGLAGKLAVKSASDDDPARILEMTRESRKSHEDEDRPTYFRINQAILEAASNDTLTRPHERVAFRVPRARYQANLTPDRWRIALEEHEAIAEAMQARDAERCAAAMRSHLLNKLASIKATAKS